MCGYSADQICNAVPRVGGGREGGQSGKYKIIEHGKDHPVVEEFEEGGGQVVSAYAQRRLQSENDRQEYGKAEQVVKIIVNQPAADVVGFENPSVQHIE
jgi:hypothetical protein